MKNFKFAALLAGLLATAAPAMAQHGHISGHWGGGGHHGSHLGLVISAPLFWPWYYPERVYYPSYPTYPAPVIVQQQAPVYIEQAPQVQIAPPPVQAAAAQPSGWWYYCNGSKAYYPYVKECPGGWTKVAPEPAR